MKVALVAFGAIATVAGTVILPVELNEIVTPDDGALIVTVQIAAAPDARDAGLHARPLRSEGTMLVTVAPLVLVMIGLPSRVAPIPPETPIDADGAFDASVTDTLATTPSIIGFALMPVAMHM